MSQKQAVITRIREHYASLGIPLDALSDREIELGVRQLAAAAREAGTGGEEATEAMRRAVEIAKRDARERAEAEAAAKADAGAGNGESGDDADDG